MSARVLQSAPESSRVTNVVGAPPPSSAQNSSTLEPLRANAKHLVLVVEADALLRKSLVDLINTQADLRCSGQASDAASAQFALSRDEPAALALCSLRDTSLLLPALLLFRSKGLNLPILVLCPADEQTHAEFAVQAGASGYIMSADPAQQFLTAIRTVLKGDVYLSYNMSQRVFQSPAGAKCLSL